MRELGRVSLLEALDLTALIALEDPRRRSRAAARWLLRFLEEHPSAAIEEAALAAGALAALGGAAHDEAHATLAALTRRPRAAAGAAGQDGSARATIRPGSRSAR